MVRWVFSLFFFLKKVEGTLNFIYPQRAVITGKQTGLNARVARTVPIPKFPSTTKQRTVVANINAPAATKCRWNALRNDA